MFQQLVLFVETNNADVKAKEFLSLLSAFAVIRHDVLLYIHRFCR
jgi:hypothetical protein